MTAGPLALAGVALVAIGLFGLVGGLRLCVEAELGRGALAAFCGDLLLVAGVGFVNRAREGRRWPTS